MDLTVLLLLAQLATLPLAQQSVAPWTTEMCTASIPPVCTAQSFAPAIREDSPTPATTPIPRAVRIAQGVYLASQVLDWESSRRAYASGNGVEANPLMPDHDGSRFAVKVMLASLMLAATSYEAKQRPKRMTVMLYLSAAVATAVSVHNFRLASQGSP